MNFNSPLRNSSRFLFRIAMNCRRYLPKKKSRAFGFLSTNELPRIQCIYVINLDRQPTRLAQMKQELKHLLDCSGAELWSLAQRHAAFDATIFTAEPEKDDDIDPNYTLGEQLFVEPQPKTLPSQPKLDMPIRMSLPEIAVARSHINIWRKIAAGVHEYVLILEDDVWFRSDFASHLDQAWDEIKSGGDNMRNFDILYVSYLEAKHGAPKIFVSKNVLRPQRGLWHLSGYILSREGAKKLLQILPCRGPVDLWINHQFNVLNVLATRRSIVSQRRDAISTNSYSGLPALIKIGAITNLGASLFHIRHSNWPVFAFGSKGSGLTSLAIALSMLGYRCCSDFKSLPKLELERLLEGSDKLVFGAYVNIGVLEGQFQNLKRLYPHAKFIFTHDSDKIEDDLAFEAAREVNSADIVVLHSKASNKWKAICELLSCDPPASSFPKLADIGQRQILGDPIEALQTQNHKKPKHDKSPWVIEHRDGWHGIQTVATEIGVSTTRNLVRITDFFEFLDSRYWFLRDDTFIANLGLFRPSNFEFRPAIGATLRIKKESLGVREYSAASITSRDEYMYGRFEAIIQASNVPGVVTGFFLHRNSPWQEIDIEIMGDRTDRLLVNVFYNPGDEGVRFHYGSRGAATYVDLGFDASESFHRYAIEWGPREICWFVDDKLVHRRVEWEPTPIPHLPMSLHVNTWPTRSKELAGKFASRRLPATTLLKSIALEAQLVERNEHVQVSGSNL